jgi:glycosyltransferase involved in cell wall biosynthesis
MHQNTILHVIEPTLTGQAGHCNSFLASVCEAAGNAPMQLWLGRSADFHASGAQVRIKPYFTRSLRRFQAYLLYRRLLAQPGRIFLSTATRTDLSLLGLAARGGIEPGRVFLYFHWFRPTPKKLAFLRKHAIRQPNLVILGPTESAVEAFRQAGFPDVRVVPYPITPREQSENDTPFRHLLFAGIARQDKGIGKVADLVAHLAQQGDDLPLLIQASADHRQRYDEKTAQDIQRLEGIRYPNLKLIEAALPQDDYLAQFEGGICLQPYDAADFADRISGISLDGLSAGAPLVVPAGTWMGRTVQRFGAGVVLEEMSAPAMLAAIMTILDDWPGFRDRARLAGKALQAEFSAGQLAAILTGDYSRPASR